nr:hypothetical protein [Actinomadura soli]
MSLPRAIRYTRAPRNGSTITKIVHPALPQPLSRSSRKMSAMILKGSIKNSTHRKNQSMDQKTFSRG